MPIFRTNRHPQKKKNKLLTFQSWYICNTINEVIQTKGNQSVEHIYHKVEQIGEGERANNQTAAESIVFLKLTIGNSENIQNTWQVIV